MREHLESYICCKLLLLQLTAKRQNHADIFGAKFHVKSYIMHIHHHFALVQLDTG